MLLCLYHGCLFYDSWNYIVNSEPLDAEGVLQRYYMQRHFNTFEFKHSLILPLVVKNSTAHHLVHNKLVVENRHFKVSIIVRVPDKFKYYLKHICLVAG